MRRRRSKLPAWAFLLLAFVATGCAARFSPATIRSEIAAQRGVDPLSVFELNLGRFTTQLIKSALTVEEGQTPFAGLGQLQLAVYETPPESGPALDVTLLDVHGWEPVIRSHDRKRSAMVLVRGGSSWGRGGSEPSISDLVVVGAGKKMVVYARLRGSLDTELPSALGDAFRRGGPEEIRRLLTEFAESGSAP